MSEAAPRPRFADGYPRDPALDRLVEAFVRGNHRLVRDEAEALAKRRETEGDPRVADAARDLRRRLDPDRLAYVLLVTTAVLLATLTAWAIRDSRAHQHDRPPVPAVQTVSK